MATLNLADGESFVKGRSAEKAGELLSFAGEDRTSEVRTTTGGYIVPSDILPEGYEAITNADLPAVRTEPGTSTNVDEVYNKGGEPTAKANVSRETEAHEQGDVQGEDVQGDGVQGEDELFDPTAHTISEVAAYLEGADDEERARVAAVEEAAKQRKGVLDLATTPEGAK